MIGMMLCRNPQLLIADEPTTALDVTIQAGIIELMSELRRKYDSSILIINALTLALLPILRTESVSCTRAI